MENSKSEQSNTGYKGIWFNKNTGCFETQVPIKGRKFQQIIKMYCGKYETLKEAVKAREDFIKSLF